MDLSGQRIVVIGAARQGTALTRYLLKHGAQVVLSDKRSAEDLREVIEELSDLPIEWALGGHPLGLLDGVSLLCPSGGVPLTIPIVKEARSRGIPLSNDSQIFIEHANCTISGITGSAGKTTTTTLVGLMAESVSGPGKFWRSSWVGGNIGRPLITVLDEMHEDDVAVMELSSFQLEIMTKSPHVASILNLTPNHLDRHGTMQAYTEAKARILDFQTGEDIAVLGRDDEVAWSLVPRVRGRLYSFGIGEQGDWESGTFVREDWIWMCDDEVEYQLLPLSAIQLRGTHNLQNILASCVIAFAMGIPIEAIKEGVQGFTGVPHRLEFVRHFRGVDWYNDSIATAPERAIAAIRSFEEPLVLLAGGRDKALPWEEFIGLVQNRIDHLILFGEIGELIQQSICDSPSFDRPYTLDRCEGLWEAVRIAAQHAQQGDVVLMSPGGTSFDEFRDFEERGERFKEWVMSL
jgi:UDP-N-acetylmuramoylalanine--D-glutamate ligase